MGDHHAPEPLIRRSLPVRTLVQGLVIDILVAICLVVIEGTATGSVDWWLILASMGRTAAQTAASSLMRRLVPLTDTRG